MGTKDSGCDFLEGQAICFLGGSVKSVAGVFRGPNGPEVACDLVTLKESWKAPSVPLLDGQYRGEGAKFDLTMFFRI